MQKLTCPKCGGTKFTDDRCGSCQVKLLVCQCGAVMLGCACGYRPPLFTLEELTKESTK